MKASTHPDAATLGAYHDGELRGALQADVAAHLAACEHCRGRVLREGAVDDALRALPMMEPPDVHDVVMARVAGARRHGSPRRPRRILVSVGAVLAALLALLAGFDATLQHNASIALPAPAAAPHAAQRTFGAPTQSPIIPAPKDGVQSLHAAPLAPNAAKRPLGSAPTAQAGRLIVRSGQVDLRVPDVQRAFHAVTALASHEGGYVADSLDAATGTGNGASARLTLRVPASAFQATMDRLVALPHDRVTQQSNSQDITDQYHNLQAQLQALQATRTQLLGLMRHAANVRDAMSVLDRLTAVDTSIDATQGQLLAQANSVMLSTITVTISPHPRQQPVVAPLRREPWEPGRTLTDALNNLEQAVQAITTAAIYLAVYLALPALLVVPLLVTRRLRRRLYRDM